MDELAINPLILPKVSEGARRGWIQLAELAAGLPSGHGAWLIASRAALCSSGGSWSASRAEHTMGAGTTKKAPVREENLSQIK
jgi:hypothetical protein